MSLMIDSKIIPMTEVYADENWNCRGPINMGEIMTLQAEIKKDGLLQPVVVRPYRSADYPNEKLDPYKDYKFALVAGFRRFKACKFLELKEISVIIKTGLDEFQARAMNMIENIERKQLNIKQEADGLVLFKKAGWTQKQTAEKLNQSVGWVSIRWTLLELEPEIQEVAAAGLLSQDNIKTIASLPPGFMRFDAVKEIKNARAKGEKSEIEKVMKLGKKKNPMKRQERKPQEIFLLIENILENIGPSLATRCMAWCAGEISDLELLRDIKEAAIKADPNHKYVPPEHMAHIRGY